MANYHGKSWLLYTTIYILFILYMYIVNYSDSYLPRNDGSKMSMFARGSPYAKAFMEKITSWLSRQMRALKVIFFSFWIRWHRFFGGLGYRSLNHLVWGYTCIPISYHVDEVCILCQEKLDALTYPAGTSSFWVLRIWESPISEPNPARCSFWKATKVGILASADTGGGVVFSLWSPCSVLFYVQGGAP